VARGVSGRAETFLWTTGWLRIGRRARIPDITVFEQRRQALGACGFQLEPPRFDLKVDEASQKWAANEVPDGAMHMSINSNNPLKEWPLDHYASMLRAVWQDRPDLRVMASGQPSRTGTRTIEEVECSRERPAACNCCPAT